MTEPNPAPLTSHRAGTEILRVGVIGAGAMGADHVSTIANSVPGARVSLVFDPDGERASRVAAVAGAKRAVSPEAVIESRDIDAVIVASPDSTHADLVLACLAQGKPVLCEKPLAVSPEEARDIVRAEMEGGRRLIQVGFMRRYDPYFLDLREAAISGVLGEVRIIHAIHRNASSSTSVEDATLISGSMVHELDTLPWLLDDELDAVRVESPVQVGFRDPQIATLWMKSGVMATVEVFVNASYGYDVACEVVGTAGTATLAPRAVVNRRIAGGEHYAIADDFVQHFRQAYQAELSDWLGSLARTGQPSGPSAWDGYVAACAASAGIKSLTTGVREPIAVEPQSPFYLSHNHLPASEA